MPLPWEPPLQKSRPIAWEAGGMRPPLCQRLPGVSKGNSARGGGSERASERGRRRRGRAQELTRSPLRGHGGGGGWDWVWEGARHDGAAAAGGSGSHRGARRRLGLSGIMRGAALALALAALEVACWTGPIPAAAAALGQPVAANTCEKECLPKQFASKPIPLKLLQSYKNSTCRMKTSVILTTKLKREFCAKPEDGWVQTVMRQLDAMNAPPSSAVDTSVSEKPAVFQKFRGDAAPTTAQVEGPASPTETFSTATHRMATVPEMTTGPPNPSVVNSVSAGSELENSSTRPVTNTEVVVTGSTMLQLEPLPNLSVIPKITDGPKGFGEGLTSVREGLEGTTRDLVASSTILGTLAKSTVSSRFSSENPMRSPARPTLPPSISSSSRLITDFTEKEMEPSTTSARLWTSSSRQSSAPSGPSTGSGPQSTAGLITGQSSTRSTTGGSKTSSVNIKDRSSTMSDPAIALGDATESPVYTEASRDTSPETPGTLPASGFRLENFIGTRTAQATANTPEVILAFLPTVLAEYRTHIIALVSLAGALCLGSAVIGWACTKYHIFPSASPKEMVQLLYSPPDSQADTYAMEML